MVEKLLGMREVADTLGLGRSKTWQLTASGDLPTVRLGRRRLVRTADLAEFIEAPVHGGPPGPPALPPVRQGRPRKR